MPFKALFFQDMQAKSEPHGSLIQKREKGIEAIVKPIEVLVFLKAAQKFY